MGGWSPLGGTEWLRNPDWVLGEGAPHHPVSTPVGRNLPPLKPYTYRGSDFSDGDDPAADLEAAIWQAMRDHEVTTRRPVAFADAILRAVAAAQPLRTLRYATALDDPALRYATCPVSAPARWIHEYEGDL